MLKFTIYYTLIAPFAFMAVGLILALAFMSLIAFVAFDTSIFADAWHSFYEGFTWAKFRFIWAVCLVVAWLVVALTDGLQ